MDGLLFHWIESKYTLPNLPVVSIANNEQLASKKLMYTKSAILLLGFGNIFWNTPLH